MFDSFMGKTLFSYGQRRKQIGKTAQAKQYSLTVLWIYARHNSMKETDRLTDGIISKPPTPSIVCIVKSYRLVYSIYQ